MSIQGETPAPPQRETEPKPQTSYPFLKLPEATDETKLSDNQIAVLKATNAFIAFSFDTRKLITDVKLDHIEDVSQLSTIQGRYQAMQAIVDHPQNLTTNIDEGILSYFDPQRKLEPGDEPVTLTNEDLVYADILQAKMQFAAHEVKNPMTTLPGWVSMLYRELHKSDPDVQKLTRDKEHITQTSARLLSVINAIPDFFSDPEKMFSTRDFQQLRLVVENQVHAVQKDTSLALSTQLDELLEPGKVKFVESFIRSLISNAVSNAEIEQATELAITARLLPADEDHNLAERVALILTDNGNGVNPVIEEHGFSFGESHHNFPSNGVTINKGVGMASNRRIFQIAGGDLIIENRTDLSDEGNIQHGARVTGTLPRV